MDAYFAQCVDFWIACKNWNLDRPALTFPKLQSANLKRRKEMASGREGGGAGGPIQVQGCREGGGGS